MFWIFHPKDKVVAQLRQTEGLLRALMVYHRDQQQPAGTQTYLCTEESILIAVTFTSTLTPPLTV